LEDGIVVMIFEVENMNPVKYKFPVYGILQLADTKLHLELIQMMFGCKNVMAYNIYYK
jgi:hypothetical protein